MAISFRQSFVGVLAVLGALAPVACSGSVTSPDPSTSKEDQSLLKEGACFPEAIGGAGSCKSADTWKEYANQACENRGLALGDFGVGAGCEGGFSEAKYTCCKSGPEPLPPPDPGGIAACFGDAQGGPTSCKPADVWTKLASDLCVAKGSSITHIAFAEECDNGSGSFRYTKYECCTQGEKPPPPPPPQQCATTVLGGADKSCAPNGSWKEKAFDYCASQKQMLHDLSFDNACGPDASSAAKVTCCSDVIAVPPEKLPPPPEKLPPPPQEKPPIDPVPPPPPQACTYDGIAAAKCTDPGTWKLNASQSCEKQGLHLTELYFGAPCENGGATEAKWACCK